MQASQKHGNSDGSRGLYYQPVQGLESYDWPPSQNRDHGLCSDDGSQATHFFVKTSDQHCTFESSTATGGYPFHNSPSTISFSPHGSPVSQPDSQSYPSDTHHSPDNTITSAVTGICLTDDDNDFRHKLFELETAMLGPDSDIHEACNIAILGGPDQISSQTEKWQQMMEMISKRDLKGVLIACAKAVGDNDLLTAEWLMSELRQMVSVSGDPLQRLGAYMLEGLVARLASSGSSIYKALKCTEPASAELLSYMHLLYELCPYFKFGYMSANGAIAEAMKDENRIHIIDFQQTQGCLRVLSLSHYHITELPNSIGNLIHLRYLDLSETKIKQLPETICSLYNLQTLLLSNCRFLTTLPVEIGKLICLRHLDISGTKLTEMPTQMSRLKGLQHLTAFMIGKYGGSGLNELKEFLHLRGTLSILGLQNVKSGNNALEAKLKEKKQLAELVLEWGSTTDDSHGEREVLGNLEPHTNLKRLTIKNYGGTRFPDWLGDHSFSNLVSLDLDKCDYCFSLPPLGQLPSLKHLNIARMNGITKVGKEFYGDGSLTKPFQSLETLRFEEMLEWVEWYVLGAGEFFQLRELRVIRCPKLVGGLPQHIPSWERLEIRQCSELVASLPRTSAAAGELVLKGCDGVKFERQVVSFLVKLQISDMISLKELTPDLCTLTNLKELEIDRCPSLLSFPNTGLPPMLRSLSILNCEAMHYVLYEGMICLNTCLQRLKISDCSSLVSFAADGLPHTLKELDIFGCPKLVFPLSEGMECHYTSLEHLSLGSCNSIELLPLGFFLKLQSLIISDCANFETLSIQHAHGLQNLTSLKIWWCPNMVSFPQEGFPAPSLTYFEMHDCKKLKSLPEQMNTLLPSLHVLNVGHCPEIESFPEGGLPSKLHLLQINRCEKLLASRREWGIRKLSSLRDFLISRSLLESFPEEGLLPSTLTKLFIHDLPNLVSLNNRGLQLLVSLEELRIWDCPQLKSLPEGGFPASLSMLEIRGCPLLKSRCRRDIGGDWHNIVHITLIMIDNVFV